MLLWQTFRCLPKSMVPGDIQPLNFTDSDIVAISRCILVSCKGTVTGVLLALASSQIHLVPIPWEPSEPLGFGCPPFLDDLRYDFWNSDVGQEAVDAQVVDMTGRWVQLTEEYVLIKNQAVQHSRTEPVVQLNPALQTFGGPGVKIRGNILIVRINYLGQVSHLMPSDVPVIVNALRHLDRSKCKYGI
ncbi:hypothetical protein NP233_g1999 [Leucocoprinus birnbaumii]|uniref:Uncharacterized protein n=1 Tax=Leucocoprinus birnbaumii TaxID=56174 RepID=A0AAD5YZ49_9AGAR|nr:hypothetical protein NP233_g1999 [Leucocoprinus birnbaumii]